MQSEFSRTEPSPDSDREERCRTGPELGPVILFFSGGSALKKVSEELIRHTHNSIHLVASTDSGGSSAKLREAFAMPAVGDIRNRLMALADRNSADNPDVFRLLAYRFPQATQKALLKSELQDMAEGKHDRVRVIPGPDRRTLGRYFADFLSLIPEEFDLCGASIGNLVLASGYLCNDRQLDPVISVFSKLVLVRGTVRPVTQENLHLVAELEDGRRIVGQHRLTGKEEPPIRSPVRRVYLTRTPESPDPREVEIREEIRRLIAEAGLICYPMGSFYSSLIANLLPQGVGAAICNNPCPKVFIPSTGSDPELFGTGLQRQVETLMAYLRKDDPAGIRPDAVLNFILLDERNESYSGGLDTRFLDRTGVEVIRRPLVSPRSAPLLDEKHLVPILLSLA